MTIIFAVAGAWLALNVAIFAFRMHATRDVAHWMKLHPGMPLHRRPLR